MSADPLAWLTEPRGRAVGVRRGPRRHRRDAARPRAAAYLARSRPPSRCCAARTRARCWRARRRRWRRCARAPATRSPQDAVRVSTELLALVPVARPLAAAGARPAARAGRRRVAARRRARPAARRRVAPTGCEALGRAADGADRGAGAAGGRGRARRPGDRGAVRLAQRDRRPGRRAAGAGGARASTRSRWSCRRPGTWRCGRRTSRTCAATATAGRAGVHAWLLYAAEAYAAGAEASPLRRAEAEPAATCERHPTRRSRVPPLTREPWLPSVHHLTAAPGGSRWQAPCRKGRSPRGYPAHVLVCELLLSCSTPVGRVFKG